LIDRLQAIFRETFEKPDFVLTLETVAADVDNWDSFNHINLVMRIEEDFGISFSTQEIGALASVKDLLAAISSKTG